LRAAEISLSDLTIASGLSYGAWAADLPETAISSATTEIKKASIVASRLISKRNAITKLGTDTTTSGPNKVTLQSAAAVSRFST
jgi:hypothetical protein